MVTCGCDKSSPYVRRSVHALHVSQCEMSHLLLALKWKDIKWQYLVSYTRHPYKAELTAVKIEHPQTNITCSGKRPILSPLHFSWCKMSRLPTQKWNYVFSILKNERGARERKIKNVCRHLWEKRGLWTPSPMSTPHHYHLRVRDTN